MLPVLPDSETGKSKNPTEWSGQITLRHFAESITLKRTPGFAILGKTQSQTQQEEIGHVYE